MMKAINLVSARKIGLVASALAGSVLLVTSCTSPVDSVIFLDDAGRGGIFEQPDGEAPSVAPDAASHLLCVGTTCPDGFGTCASGGGPAYKCGTDLKRDVDHCGACGNKCLHYGRLHMTSRCIEGGCELECWSPKMPGDEGEWRNCNGKVDDGCEVDVNTDDKNCGACGNVCANGVPCVEGKCGCPSGQIACDGACVDPLHDNGNCGGCGITCEQTDGPCTLPDTAYYGCAGGVCGAPKCRGSSGDCNNDLGDPECNTDGCEVEDINFDPNNCGGCGIKCDTEAGEKCINGKNGAYCAVQCVGKGMTFCPLLGCRDFLNDSTACGSCTNVCPEAGPNQLRACRKGLCELDCLPGFGDCNGDPSDGCETNLLAHPGNCGTCGNACDLNAGQPCIHGKCLMTECSDAGKVN